jgi:hypothetical protein
MQALLLIIFYYHSAAKAKTEEKEKKDAAAAKRASAKKPPVTAKTAKPGVAGEAWVHKYAPRGLDDMVGNQTLVSNPESLWGTQSSFHFLI